MQVYRELNGVEEITLEQMRCLEELITGSENRSVRKKPEDRYNGYILLKNYYPQLGSNISCEDIPLYIQFNLEILIHHETPVDLVSKLWNILHKAAIEED